MNYEENRESVWNSYELSSDEKGTISIDYNHIFDIDNVDNGEWFVEKSVANE